MEGHQRELDTASMVVSESCDRIRFLEDRNIDLEARGRRNNVVVFGVPEVDREDCVEVMKKEVLEKCGITGDAVIERAHRFGRRRDDKPRPLIARFLDFNAKQRVMRARKQLPDRVRFADDLPYPIRQARKALVPDLMKARSEDTDAFIAYPARLIVAGSEVRVERPSFGDQRSDKGQQHGDRRGDGHHDDRQHGDRHQGAGLYGNGRLGSGQHSRGQSWGGQPWGGQPWGRGGGVPDQQHSSRGTRGQRGHRGHY